MSMSKLDQLRATMESLDSYQLDEKFSEPPVDQVLDDETIQRYKKARDEYIHRRMLQVFYDHVGSLNENGEFTLPQLPSPQEQDELAKKRADVQRDLVATAESLNQDKNALLAKYTAFCARRQELAKMIADIEENPSSQDLLMEDDEVGDVDQEAFTYEGQHLADATQRKAELQLELERIRHEKSMAQKALEETKNQVEALQKQRGAIVRSVSPETLQELESDTANMRKKVEELKEMSEWYGGLCQVMEEIGGIKLLGVDNAENGDDEVVVAKVELFDKHQVHVNMTSRGNAFHVTDAKFVTPTLVRSQQDAESSVQMNIPPLDDLVRLSSNLGSVEDLRFLLRETMARIQTITARVDELAILRTRFLTKIGKLQTSQETYSFGGQDQEVVCSLNEGITAVLRLSPDCPMLNGSVLLDQIVGVGGWDIALLDRIKDRVNASPNCKGPVALMETLVKEIRRIQTEEGISLPGTPSMPIRK